MRRRADYSIINKKGCESDCSHILFCCLRRRDYSQFRGGGLGRCAALRRKICSPALSQGLLTRRLMAPFHSQRLLRRAKRHTGVSDLNGSSNNHSSCSNLGAGSIRASSPGRAILALYNCTTKKIALSIMALK